MKNIYSLMGLAPLLAYKPICQNISKTILILLIGLNASLANAQYFTNNGLVYVATTGTNVQIVEGCLSGELIIPSSIINDGIEHYVTYIGDDAFSQCVSLSSVTIPSSISSIGDNAFANCNGLTELTVSWETPLDIVANVFYQLVLSDITLNVPNGALESYQAANVWKSFSPIQANPTSISSNILPQLVLFPNPTSSNITISVEQDSHLEITNILGEIVLCKDIINGESNLQTSGLNKGIYFVNLYGEKENQVFRFIKQ
ncbi:MAG: leucine-rich repeat protein [Flavobacteriales bacterium]